jgi:prepilin-type N-terminal cleavage/methylation domain-containing protein
MHFTRKQQSPEAGFTMLEVLIAVTLVAMLSIGLYAVLRISLRVWSRGTEYTDANQRNRSVMDLMRKQIASAYPLNTSPDQQQQGAAAHPIFNGDDTGFSFVSLDALQFNSSPGLTFVSYEIAQDSNGMYSLIEKETPYTRQLTVETGSTIGLSDSIAVEDNADQFQEITIFDNLTNCTFEYLDPGTSDTTGTTTGTGTTTTTGTTGTTASTTTATPQWVTEWVGQDKMRLPLAVRITMVNLDAQGRSTERSIVTAIKAEPAGTSSSSQTTVRAR